MARRWMRTGRVYVSTGSSVDVFSPAGEFLGSIPAPRGTHGVMLGGKDGRTLFAQAIRN